MPMTRLTKIPTPKTREGMKAMSAPMLVPMPVSRTSVVPRLAIETVSNGNDSGPSVTLDTESRVMLSSEGPAESAMSIPVGVGR